MRLSHKIRRLKKQEGQHKESVATGVPALKAQLDRCRITAQKKQEERKCEASLAAKLKGVVLSRGVVLIEKTFEPGEFHGRMQFKSLLASDSGASSRLVFMDTETTGLSGGTGTHVFVLGLGVFDLEKKHFISRQYLLTSVSGERAMLEDAARWVRNDDVLVTYNGKSFDVPLLSTRYRLANITDPFESLQHIDLLYPVRRLFKSRWPDCRLSRVEKKLLHLTRTDDLPGSVAPEVWFEWLRFGVSERLAGVIKHNRLDILSLAMLIPVMEKIEKQPREFDADVLQLARHYLRSDERDRAFRLLLEHRKQLCARGLLELACLYRRNSDWVQALDIWKELARQGNLDAIEHLAKYYEHQAGDVAAAIEATSVLLTRDAANPGYLHRYRRLTARA